MGSKISPYSWNKFQICCTDTYLIRFYRISRYVTCFCEFHGISQIYLNSTAPRSEALFPPQKCLKKIINREFMVDNIQRPRAKFETKNKYFVWIAWTSSAMWSFRWHHRKLATNPQERIVNGWEVQSLVPIQRGFSLFVIAMASLMQHLIVLFLSAIVLLLCAGWCCDPLHSSAWKQHKFHGIGVLWCC